MLESGYVQNSTMPAYHDAPTAVPWSNFKAVVVPQSVFSALCTIMTIVTIVSATLNGTVIYITYKSPTMRKPIDCLMLNLALADFFNAVLGGIPTVVANSAGYFILGRFVCKASAFVIAVMGIADLFTITLLSVLRFIIVCKPKGICVLNQKHTKLAIAIIWLWSLSWHIPLLVWDGYDLEGVGTSCGGNWKGGGSLVRILLFLYLIFCFVVPLAVLVICYISIVRYIKKTYNQTSMPQNQVDESERRLTKMVLIITTAFLCCWSPYATLAIFELSHPTYHLNQYVETFPAFLAKTATIYNPFIYMFMNRKVKDNFIVVLGLKRTTSGTNVSLERVSPQQGLVSYSDS